MSVGCGGSSSICCPADDVFLGGDRHCYLRGLLEETTSVRSAIHVSEKRSPTSSTYDESKACREAANTFIME